LKKLERKRKGERVREREIKNQKGDRKRERERI
jgi:hypothetical protein